MRNPFWEKKSILDLSRLKEFKLEICQSKTLRGGDLHSERTASEVFKDTYARQPHRIEGIDG